MNNVINNIKKLRALKSLNQNDFAKSIGISRVSLSQIELENQNLTLPQFIKIAKTYNISTDLLLFGDLGTNNLSIASKPSERSIAKNIDIKDSNSDELLKQKISFLEREIELLNEIIRILKAK